VFVLQVSLSFSCSPEWSTSTGWNTGQKSRASTFCAVERHISSPTLLQVAFHSHCCISHRVILYIYPSTLHISIQKRFASWRNRRKKCLSIAWAIWLDPCTCPNLPCMLPHYIVGLWIRFGHSPKEFGIYNFDRSGLGRLLLMRLWMRADDPVSRSRYYWSSHPGHKKATNGWWWSKDSLLSIFFERKWNSSW
jgi:hypothetical protein